MTFLEFKDRYENKAVEEYPHQVIDKPVVSVCVQTYNHALYIRDCLDGILMQKTDFPIEILLGEDSSTDGTRRICKDYAQKHPDKIRLFLHHRENNIRIGGEPTGRFNFLYNRYSVRGKYIALCEGDDYWMDPLKLQKQVDFLEENKDCSLVFTGFKNVNAKGKTSRVFSYKNLKKLNPSAFISNTYAARTLTLLFRKNVIEDTPSEEWMLNAFAGDFVLKYRALTIGNFGYIKDITSVYNGKTLGSFSSRKMTKSRAFKQYKDYTRALRYLDKFQLLEPNAKKKRSIEIQRLFYFQIAQTKANPLNGLFYLFWNFKKIGWHYLMVFIKRKFL